MIKAVGLGILLLIVALAVVIALRPAEFLVERSAVIQAPPGQVFNEVNDLRKWQAWSPWENIDPQLKRVYEGPLVGVGATYAWTGNNNVGEGRMTVVESAPDQLVRIKLEFIKPFAATNAAEFLFNRSADGTQVTWRMSGHNNFIAKAIGLFMNMDKMVGEQFEQGLANLKLVVEAPATR